MSIHAQILALLLSCLLNTAHAEDLGTVGPTYDIAERDLLDAIESSLSRMAESGELGQKQREYRDRVIGSIEKPKPLAEIKTTTTKRTFYVDSTWVLDRDIRGADGSLLFARGLKINPFDHISLREKLIFFDGRDLQQVSFAKKTLQKLNGQAKPILVAGEPLKLMRDWKSRVFYDQGGTLIHKFGIHQVPAIVAQDGKRFRVDEVRP